MSQTTEPVRHIVLVVEDEPLLRINAVDIIEDAGFDTVEAPNADEAMKILKARADIKIVFTDINMPGSLDGLKLAHFIRDRWPPIDLIITSGQFTPEPKDLPTECRFISKPFEPEQLVAALMDATV